MADNTTSGTDAIRTVDRSGAGPKTAASIIDVLGTGSAEQLGLGDVKVVSAATSGLTTATTAYTSGDVLGTEITLSGIARSTSLGSMLAWAMVIDKGNVIPAVDGYLFSAASTPAADNAANSWADADMANCLGVIRFNDIQSSALNRVAMATNLPILVSGLTSVRLVLVCRGSVAVFSSSTDLSVVTGWQRD